MNEMACVSYVSAQHAHSAEPRSAEPVIRRVSRVKGTAVKVTDLPAPVERDIVIGKGGVLERYLESTAVPHYVDCTY